MERRDRIVLGLFVATIMATALVVGVVIAGSRAEPGGGCSASCAELPLPAQRCEVARGVLPEWARTGFSDPRPRSPHVIGAEGELAAILLGDPLTAPARPGRSNKILWVARRTPRPGPLRLVAQDGSRTVRRVVENGPGPSAVDLPAGCWRIAATWAGGEDVVELSYSPR